MATAIVHILRAGQTISAISRTSNTVSVTLSASYPNNNLKVGQSIVINTGTGGTASFNGTFTIASVASQTSFTYTQIDSDETGTVGTTPVAGGDYSLMSTWESSEQRDLVALDETETLECYNDWPSGLSDSISISAAWTTDSTRYIKIVTPSSERHNGIPRTGFYISKTLNWDGIIYNPDNKHLWCEGLDIKQVGGADSECISGASNITIIACILENTNLTGLSYGTLLNNGVSNITIRNSILIGGRNGLMIGAYANNVDICNNVSAGAGDVGVKIGWSTTASTVRLANIAVFNATNVSYSLDSAILSGSTLLNNAASDGSTVTPPGTNPLTVDIVSGDFVDAANYDFSLTSTSQLRDAGADLSAGGFTTDILGNPRGV